MIELPTGTVTLLLADVEGSTRLWETQPDRMTAAVARFEQTVSEAVAAHGGVRPVEQGEGDSFVAAFARASMRWRGAAVAAGAAGADRLRIGYIPAKCSCATRATTPVRRSTGLTTARSGPRRPDRVVGCNRGHGR